MTYDQFSNQKSPQRKFVQKTHTPLNVQRRQKTRQSAHGMTGYSPRCPLFYTCSHYMISQNGHANILAKFFIVFKNQISQYTIYFLNCVLGYIFIYLLFIILLQKACPFRFLGFFAFFQNLNSSFLHLKRAHDLEVNIYVDPYLPA